MPENSLIERYIQSNAFGRLLGMDFKILAPGKLEYRLLVNKDHLATPQSAHGGVISSLVDGALGTAGLSAVYQENKVVSTIEYKINFLAPVLVGDELLASANVESQGKRILVVGCEVRVKNRNGILVAKALGTFNAYPAEKAGY
jgi:uncharacterized protein (TIGR00369 family)